MGPISKPYSFSKACADFRDVIIEPILENSSSRRYVTAAILVAAAVEPLSGAHLPKDVLTSSAHYIDWVERNLRGYEKFAYVLYSGLRCGLLHDMRLDSKRNGRSGLRAPIMLAPIADEPKLLTDELGRVSLLIGTLHLVASFIMAFEDFVRSSDAATQRGFPERFRLTLIDVPVPSTLDPQRAVQAVAFGAQPQEWAY